MPTLDAKLLAASTLFNPDTATDRVEYNTLGKANVFLTVLANVAEEVSAFSRGEKVFCNPKEFPKTVVVGITTGPSDITLQIKRALRERYEEELGELLKGKEFQVDGETFSAEELSPYIRSLCQQWRKALGISAINPEFDDL